jgi:hypothetical protein
MLIAAPDAMGQILVVAHDMVLILAVCLLT